jgi:hypothetical protein
VWGEYLRAGRELRVRTNKIVAAGAVVAMTVGSVTLATAAQAATVPTPVISTATTNVVTASGTISGYLPPPFAAGTPVSLTLDGHQAASTTADSSGDWSFSLAMLPVGAHSYTVTAGSGDSTAAKSGTLSIGQITVSGTPQVGRALTVGVTGVPSDGTAAYQWYENDAAVLAGGPYLIPASAVGQAITATVTVTESGHSVSVSSDQITIAPGTIYNFTGPSVTGAIRVGLKVVASPGTWSDIAPTFTYQWLDNGRPISGGTGASYVVPASLAGAKLSVTVTAHARGYNNAARTTAAILVGKGILTATVRPRLSGTPVVGKRLAVTTGTWGPPAAIKIQWYANGKPVARATGTSLLLTAALRGQAISVTVTASKAGYATAVVRLAESTRVK